MLIERITGALTFKRQVYADVKKDTSFTLAAWGIVVIGALVSSFGYAASGISANGSTNVSALLFGGLVATVISLASFGLAALAMTWVGKALLKADVSFGEMVRILGLAQIWNLLSAAGVLGSFVPALSCIATPFACLAPILTLVSWFISTQETLGLSTGQAAITVIIGWMASFLLTAVSIGILFLALGLALGGGSAIMDMLQNFAP